MKPEHRESELGDWSTCWDFHFPADFSTQQGELGEATTAFSTMMCRKLRSVYEYCMMPNGALMERCPPECSASFGYSLDKAHIDMCSAFRLLRGLNPPPPTFATFTSLQFPTKEITVPQRETKGMLKSLIGRVAALISTDTSELDRKRESQNQERLKSKHHTNHIQKQYDDLQAWFASQWESGRAQEALLNWYRRGAHDPDRREERWWGYSPNQKADEPVNRD